jgi:hypothetical protein
MRRHHPLAHSSERDPHAGMPLWRVGPWFLPAYWATVLCLALLLWYFS